MSVLTDPERLALETAVSDHLGIPIATQVLRDLIGLERFQRIANYPAPYEYARSVVRITLGEPGPELLIKVITDIDGVVGKYPVLHDLVAALQSNARAWLPAVAEVLWVPNDWPFVDREDLRTLFSEMETGGGPPALVIEGGSGEGKRTMAKYIEELPRGGSFKPIATDLRAEAITDRDLPLIASRLRVALGLDADTDTTHALPERQAQVLANELAREAVFTNGPPVWWVAVVPTASAVAAEVLRFVDEVLGWVHSSPQVAARLRVVLLTEQVSLLELKNQPPVEARRVLPSVTQDHVVAWLKAAAPGKDEPLYGIAAKFVLDEVANRNPDAPKRLYVLASQCIVAQKQLAKTGGG